MYVLLILNPLYYYIYHYVCMANAVSKPVLIIAFV